MSQILTTYQIIQALVGGRFGHSAIQYQDLHRENPSICYVMVSVAGCNILVEADPAKVQALLQRAAELGATGWTDLVTARRRTHIEGRPAPQESLIAFMPANQTGISADDQLTLREWLSQQK